MFKRFFALFISLSLCVGTVWAGDFEDGFSAYEKKDYATALKKFRLAATQGNVGAQGYLAGMYALGEGVTQDFVKAHMWFNLAATKGNSSAIKGRDLVAAQATPQQIAEAQKMARECQARNFKNCD